MAIRDTQDVLVFENILTGQGLKDEQDILIIEVKSTPIGYMKGAQDIFIFELPMNSTSSASSFGTLIGF